MRGVKSWKAASSWPLGDWKKFDVLSRQTGSGRRFSRWFGGSFCSFLPPVRSSIRESIEDVGYMRSRNFGGPGRAALPGAAFCRRKDTSLTGYHRIRTPDNDPRALGLQGRQRFGEASEAAPVDLVDFACRVRGAGASSCPPLAFGCGAQEWSSGCGAAW